MSLQNLWKEVSSRLKQIDPKEILFFLEHNKKEMGIIAVCVVVMVVLIGVLIGRITGKGRREAVVTATAGGKTVSLKGDGNTRAFDEDTLFLLQGVLYYPDRTDDDLTNDYVELFPLNRYNRPDMKQIDKEFDKVIDKNIDDTCTFNFEKRRGG